MMRDNGIKMTIPHRRSYIVFYPEDVKEAFNKINLFKATLKLIRDNKEAFRVFCIQLSAYYNKLFNSEYIVEKIVCSRLFCLNKKSF